MRREDLHELHYISLLDNIQSIVARGILSHVRASKVPHQSWDSGVQDRRRHTRVPGGRRLHEYVNLYFHARNPALFKLVREIKDHKDLCVFRVSSDVLDIPGTIITDMNAARRWCRFEPAPDGLAVVGKELVLAEWWTDDDPVEQDRRKAHRCAEVLVPDRVPPEYLMGAYASCSLAKARFDALNTGLEVTVDEHMFFNEGR